MIKLRLAILGAFAALALGTASALAMTSSLSGGDPDSHGDAVASAARNCPQGAGGVHGACVSAVAHETNGAGNDAQASAKVRACKGASPKSGTTASKADKKAAHRAFAACVSGHARTETSAQAATP